MRITIDGEASIILTPRNLMVYLACTVSSVGWNTMVIV